MREIKFRAWDDKAKAMISADNLAFETYLPLWMQFKGSTLQFMQYTGLDDDSNKEIYEGDILYFEEESEFLGYVYFQDGCFYVSGVNEPLHEWNMACRVEGNIYEDAERYRRL